MEKRDLVEYCFPLDDTLKLCICKNVYKPAEDTWLALTLIDEVSNSKMPVDKVVDIGSGTGVLGIYALIKLKARLLIQVDINPYSCMCSKVNIKENDLESASEIICCDNVSCLNCKALRDSIIIYNTPYLPVKEDDLLGLAWSGGLSEAIRTVYSTIPCKPRCVILVYSSLSGDDSQLISYLKSRGYSIRRKTVHLFFEDIIGVQACRAE
jgi:release factor glutamine methyltransferase